MKAPLLAEQEIARLNQVRHRDEKKIFPDLPDYFDNGRLIPYKDGIDEYHDEWIIEALRGGEILTTINQDGSLVDKIFASAFGDAYRLSILRCPLTKK